MHVRVKPDDTPTLYHLLLVDGGGDGAPVLTLVNKRHGTIKLSYNTECEVTFPFPELGYFWYNNQVAVLFQRSNQRQWRRGICNGTAALVIPYHTYDRRLQLSFTEDVLTSAFNPIFVRFQDAVDLIQGKSALSVPLSSTLAIGASPDPDYHGLILWFYGKPVASLANGVIRMREAQFTQEILDYVRESGTNVTVV